MAITKKDLQRLIDKLDEKDTERICKLIAIFQEPTRAEMIKRWEDHIASQGEEELNLSDEEKEQLAVREYISWEELKKENELTN
jgi:hypothetical protein